MTYEHMLKKNKKIEQKIKQIQTKLKKLPEGQLYCSSSGKYTKWFCSNGKDQIYICKIYNKNVGLRQNKNVGKPTFLFCILGHIDTLLLEVFQYENQFTRRVNHHGQFRG